MPEIKCPNCGELIEISKSDYDSLLNDIEKSEITARVQEQVKLMQAKYDSDLKLAKTEANNLNNDEIQKLKDTIAKLETSIKVFESEKALAVATAENQLKEKLSQKDNEITKLKSDLSVEITKKENEIANLKASHQKEIEIKDNDIEKWKSYRLGNSTKDLGESLEQYCHDAFDEIRAAAYPRAVFEKDNLVDEEGKGDFIFRDYDENGVEYISIMFEMKNQNDTTKTKHKNEDFFSKLDKNRTSKNCEYAVLVSTLEEDSKLYNNGIVDVSHRYPKMFVIRPQHFLSIIGLLRNAALNNLQIKRELVQYQQQNVDIVNFENAVKTISEKIGTDYERASAIYTEVDNMCQGIIDKVERFRKEFKTATGWIEKAKNQLPNLEVRKLTRNNPTMKEKFAELDNKEE